MEHTGKQGFDAVLLLVSEQEAKQLTREPAVQDFITDAYNHNKFIAFTPEAVSLFKAVGLEDKLDNGCVNLGQNILDYFLTKCKLLRFWDREIIK